MPKQFFYKNSSGSHNIGISKLATIVEGNPKAPFSIATTQGVGGALLLTWIAPLYPWSVPYNAEC